MTPFAKDEVRALFDMGCVMRVSFAEQPVGLCDLCAKLRGVWEWCAMNHVDVEEIELPPLPVFCDDEPDEDVEGRSWLSYDECDLLVCDPEEGFMLVPRKDVEEVVCSPGRAYR